MKRRLYFLLLQRVTIFVGFKASYLNKLNKFVAWDSQKTDLNGHPLSNISETLFGYFQLLDSKSKMTLY